MLRRLRLLVLILAALLEVGFDDERELYCFVLDRFFDADGGGDEDLPLQWLHKMTIVAINIRCFLIFQISKLRLMMVSWRLG